jgi:lysylphosphatidylglycerol synthetase-like protein (DUF2156 family)
MLNKELIKGIMFFGALVVLSRVVPHPPNFTPLLAGLIFLPFFLTNKLLAMSLSITTMFIADLIIGFHGLMFWTYFSLLLLVSLSFRSFSKKFISVIKLSFLFPIVFFLITNFGVWVSTDMYPQTISGLVVSYTMALPFLTNSLISTFLFSISFYLIFLFMERKKVESSQLGL